MRYKDQAVQPPKSKVKEEKPREMTKPGSYGREQLESTKKINTGRGNF